MLWSVVNTVVFSFLSSLQITILGTPHLQVDAALPPGTEDEVVLIEHLPGRRVHLQDFFWTGAEDAPPWLDPDQTLTLYGPRTVHHTATVYLPDDGTGVFLPGDSGVSSDPIDQGCVSCIEPTPTLTDVDQEIGVLIGEDPGPRYWLLTVLRAGETVPQRVELRLARLYRAAFSRQQQRHLGLLKIDGRVKRSAKRWSKRAKRQRRDHREVSQTESQIQKPMDSNNMDTTQFRPEVTLKSPVEVKQMTAHPIRAVTRGSFNVSLTPGRNRTMNLQMRENMTEKGLPDESKPNKTSSNETFDNTTNTVPLVNLETVHQGRSSDLMNSLLSVSKRFFDLDNSTVTFNATKEKLRDLDVAAVQVRMQNTSVTEAGATKLIYSVHLGGKPVPAASAARDMALLSEQEVALELGAPVIIQSEPYLKETRPLALSRKRDAWLLVGAAGAGLVLLAFVLAGLILAAKRKRAHSAVSAPPLQSILKKDRENTPTTPGLDNTGYTTETEARTEGTSRRFTPGSEPRTPLTPGTPDSVVADVHDVSSDLEQNLKKERSSTPWDGEEYATILRRHRPARRRVTRAHAVDLPRTPDSMEDVNDALETLENGYAPLKEATTSPHSYLSMPSCKQFPRMRSVEPLCKVLEPVVVRHLDLELDSPDMPRRDHGFRRNNNETYLTRVPSAINDPGVVGPIVWDLRKQRAIEDTTSETDQEVPIISGPVGRARRRLHELLEDSFSLFGTRDQKSKVTTPPLRPPSANHSQGHLKVLSENRGKSANVSPVATPTSEVRARPRTSLPRKAPEEVIPETGDSGPHPRGAWGSRPLSAGPFHRPILPEVDTVRILSDSQLPLQDPAVPLIAAIKKELEKFSPPSP